MKVAVIEFPTKCLLGIIGDADAELIALEFGAAEEPLAAESGAAEEPARGAIIRVQYPARNESANWFQPGPLEGQQQFVVQNFVALTGASRMTIDLGQALSADVFEAADGTTAIISGDGVRPAGQPTSDEPIVARYLAALAAVGVAPLRMGGGRHKVPRE